MLQGSEALQFSFRSSGINPEVHEQQLRDIKIFHHPNYLPTECEYKVENRLIFPDSLEKEHGSEHTDDHSCWQEC
jgi:hypothetical protein